MMETQWTDLEVKERFSDCRNLGEVITKIESDHQQRGEVICEIRVNGMLLAESDESKYAENPISGIRELSVRSDRPSDVINGAIQSAVHLIRGLEKSALNTAEFLRGPDAAQASQAFSQTVDACQYLVETLIQIRSASGNIGRALTQAERWFSAEKALATAITDLSKAYIGGDSSLTADILEYEVTGALEAWREILIAENPSCT